ncbi:MAG: hypothetical protein WA749_09605 [Gelidibacter sp.]
MKRCTELGHGTLCITNQCFGRYHDCWWAIKTIPYSNDPDKLRKYNLSFSEFKDAVIANNHNRNGKHPGARWARIRCSWLGAICITITGFNQ